MSVVGTERAVSLRGGGTENGSNGHGKMESIRTRLWHSGRTEKDSNGHKKTHSIFTLWLIRKHQIPPQEATEPVKRFSSPAVLIYRRRSIPEIVADYHSQAFHTASRLRDTHQDLWAGLVAGTTLPEADVSTPPLSAVDIRRLERDGFIGFIPHGLSNAGNRERLAKVLDLSVTRIRDQFGGETGIKLTTPTNVYGEEGGNARNLYGGFWYSAENNAYPAEEYSNMTEAQAIKLFLKNGNLPHNLSLYLLTRWYGRHMHDFTSDGSWTARTRISASIHEGRPIQAHWPKGILAFDNYHRWGGHDPEVRERPIQVYGLEQAHSLYTNHAANRLAMHS